jgi:hypothetical protein
MLLDTVELRQTAFWWMSDLSANQHSNKNNWPTPTANKIIDFMNAPWQWIRNNI